MGPGGESVQVRNRTEHGLEAKLLEVPMPLAIVRPASSPKPGRLRAVVPLALVLSGGVLCVPPTGAGQTSGVNQGGPDYIHAPAGLNPMPQQGSSDGASKVDQMRQAERHRHLTADSAKLLELATELKAQVDQAPKDQLSLDAIRKAAEIEKLAHDLKGWMKS